MCVHSCCFPQIRSIFHVICTLSLMLVCFTLTAPRRSKRVSVTKRVKKSAGRREAFVADQRSRTGEGKTGEARTGRPRLCTRQPVVQPVLQPLPIKTNLGGYAVAASNKTDVLLLSEFNNVRIITNRLL